MKVTDYLDEFIKDLTEQLEKDQKKWGSTWIMRPREGQEKRIEARIAAYFDQFKYGKTPVPWLKIAGNCMIAHIRDQHPELFDTP